jgi:hypothetical protein
VVAVAVPVPVAIVDDPRLHRTVVAGSYRDEQCRVEFAAAEGRAGFVTLRQSGSTRGPPRPDWRPGRAGTYYRTGTHG